MKLITVEGTEAEVRAAREVPGFLAVLGSARQIEPDHWSLSGYANDAAVTALESVGAIVAVHKNDEEMDQHLASLRTDDTGSPGVA
jgi:hypothetical protein